MTERVDLFDNIYSHFTEPVVNAVHALEVASGSGGPVSRRETRFLKYAAHMEPLL